MSNPTVSGNSATSVLVNHMTPQPPSDPKWSPELLNVQRVKEFEMDWVSIISGGNDLSDEQFEAKMVESDSTAQKMISERLVAYFNHAWGPTNFLKWTVERPRNQVFVDPDGTNPSSVTDKVELYKHPSGREYACLNGRGEIVPLFYVNRQENGLPDQLITPEELCQKYGICPTDLRAPEDQLGQPPWVDPVRPGWLQAGGLDVLRNITERRLTQIGQVPGGLGDLGNLDLGDLGNLDLGDLTGLGGNGNGNSGGFGGLGGLGPGPVSPPLEIVSPLDSDIATSEGGLAMSASMPEGEDEETTVPPPPVDEDEDSDSSSGPEIKIVYNSDVQSIVQVFDSAEAAKAGASSMNYLSNELSNLLREFLYLRAEKDAYDEIWKQVDEKFKTRVGSQIDQIWEDLEVAENLANRYAELRQHENEVDLALNRLSRRFRDHNYFLALRPGKIKLPNGKTVSYSEGQIFEMTLGTYRWTTTHTYYKTRVRRKCGRRKVYRTRVTRVVHRKKVSHKYRLVYDIHADRASEDSKLFRDPVEEFINSKDGMEVYVFRKTAAGYQTDDGMNLRDVLERCEEDEAYRLNCIALVPDYGNLYSMNDYIQGYQIYNRPTPGILPQDYPQIGIKETLNYQIAWTGYELGQLLRSINLAPGETRKISISSSFSSQSNQSSSLRTLSESSRLNKFDFVREFRKEATHEVKRKNRLSASASGSGSLGPFSVGGSASGSHSTSVRDFSRKTSKLVRKVTREINDKLSREVNISVSQSEKVDIDRSETMEISNINPGASLNLMFYQLQNNYRGGLYLEDLEIYIRDTKELIAGSNLFDYRTYKMSEVEDVVDLLGPENLPVIVRHQPNYWKRLIQALIDNLKEDYLRGPRPLIDFEDVDEDQKAGSDRLDQILNEADLGKKIDELIDLMNNLTISEVPLVDEHLSIVSGGVYLDSLVGTMPATEGYSETMRSLEIRKGEEEIRQLQAETSLTEVKSRALAGEANRITRFALQEAVGKLVIFTELQLEEGDWKVVLNDRVLEFDLNILPNRTVVHVEWVGNLPELDHLKSELMLLDMDSGTALGYY